MFIINHEISANLIFCKTIIFNVSINEHFYNALSHSFCLMQLLMRSRFDSNKKSFVNFFNGLESKLDHLFCLIALVVPKKKIRSLNSVPNNHEEIHYFKWCEQFMRNHAKSLGLVGMIKRFASSQSFLSFFA